MFVDSGYAWDKDRETAFDLGELKYSYGVGLRINSPLGPVKLDYGYGDQADVSISASAVNSKTGGSMP